MFCNVSGTNYAGEPLCTTCKYRGVNRDQPKEFDCYILKSRVENVGICKYYRSVPSS